MNRYIESHWSLISQLLQQMGISLLANTISIKGDDARVAMRSTSFNGRDFDQDIQSPGPRKKFMLEGSISFNGRELDKRIAHKSPHYDMEESVNHKSITCRSRETRGQLLTADSRSQKNLQMRLSGSADLRHQAALKLQKTYKSFRIRRQLADCAVLVEQRWFVSVKGSFGYLKYTHFLIQKSSLGTLIIRWILTFY